jgi:hypothetical protein
MNYTVYIDGFNYNVENEDNPPFTGFVQEFTSYTDSDYYCNYSEFCNS